jgi:dTDP-4-amino-4,6-dideoxygalactose transaminase
MKALGLKLGAGEVITTPYSFYATTAAIKNAGGDPVYIDVGRDFNIDTKLLEKAINPHTVGIVPVHWAGRPCNMNAVMGIARVHGLWVVEDCAHAPGSTYHGRRCGSFGDINAFSLHPLKNVNVWGDGGVITTNKDAHAERLRRLRNHGMSDRNTCEFWGYNSRLDTVQAVIARHVLSGIGDITKRRRENAAYLDIALAGIPQIEIPATAEDTEPNYYLYSFHAERRDALQKFLIAHGVDAKVHYPTPLHLQPAAKSIGNFKRGDFPVAEWCADTTISLPVHEFVTPEQLGFMAARVRHFYEEI